MKIVIIVAEHKSNFELQLFDEARSASVKMYRENKQVLGA